MKKTLLVSRDLICIIFGCALIAFALKNLIMTHDLLSGGITGVTLLIHHLTGWSVGIQYFIYNIPLLILGYYYIGRKFAIYSIFGVTVLSVFIKITPVGTEWTDNPLLGAIFGGVISGIGGAIVLRFGGSTGGLDVVGRVISKFKDINMGTFNMIVNSIIVLASAYFFTVELAMYTLISIYAGSKTYDVLLNHIDRITAVVITTNGQAVCKSLLHNMKRGVTTWDAHGAYTENGKQVLFSVMTRQQIDTFEELVLSEDEHAFITYLPTQSVKGNFKNNW